MKSYDKNRLKKKAQKRLDYRWIWRREMIHRETKNIWHFGSGNTCGYRRYGFRLSQARYRNVPAPTFWSRERSAALRPVIHITTLLCVLFTMYFRFNEINSMWGSVSAICFICIHSRQAFALGQILGSPYTLQFDHTILIQLYQNYVLKREQVHLSYYLLL